MQTNVIQKIKTAPKNPGVYIFYRNQAPLYIGKASNLKNRLQNYLKISDHKTEALHREANGLKLVELHSNIEALIVESRLIKTLKPKLNTLWKDDKNYFYVAVTKEQFPRVFITHQPSNAQRLTSNCIGPFTDGQSIKAVLGLLRKFFPYCSCFQSHLRLCLNAQIGNCPGHCCNRQTQPNKKQIAEYRKNIQKIKNVLVGKDKKFIHQLKDPYELLILDKIWRHQPYLSETPNPKPQNPNKFKIQDSKNWELGIGAWDFSRAECYDNSHLSGKEAVGAMTVWKRLTTDDEQPTTKWIADKNSWRKFKIQGQYTEDDPRMMAEMLERRLNHPEWPYPDLIIIDGGITQLNATKTAVRRLTLDVRNVRKLLPTSNISNIKLISYAKPQKLVFGIEKYPVPLNRLPLELQKIIGLAIAQTHNFAQRYHRQIRQKQFLNI